MGDLTTHIDNPVGENISPQFDIIHNPFDYPSLAFSKLVKTPVVTTIHGFSSPDIYRVYEKYNDNTDQAVNMVERLVATNRKDCTKHVEEHFTVDTMNVGITHEDVLTELCTKYGQDPLTGKPLYSL